MRKKLKEHGRNSRGAGFAVGTVPKASPAPFRIESLAYVVHDLGLHEIRVHPLLESVLAVGELVAAVAKESVDGQCTDDGIIRGGARVRVERE